MGLTVSVVVASRNRAGLLVSAEASLQIQRLAKEQYEVILVDNGSTDGTAAMISWWEHSERNVRGIRVETPGLSRARNAGIRAARGKLVAFLDDDAFAWPEWLQQVIEAFDEAGEKAACVGGRVEPWWGRPRPRWLGDGLLGFVSALDLGESPCWLPSDRSVYGTNMAFRRECLIEVGCFDERLGRRDGLLLSGEEEDVQHRLRRAGYGIYYDPRIVVRHRVPEERLTPRWFVRRAYWQGVTERMSSRAGGEGPLARMLRAAGGTAEKGTTLGVTWVAVVCALARLCGYYCPIQHGDPWRSRRPASERADAEKQG